MIKKISIHVSLFLLFQIAEGFLSVFSADKESIAPKVFLTKLKGGVIQKHDGEAVSNALIVLTLGEKQYKTNTGKTGYYEIDNIALENALLNNSAFDLYYNDIPIFKENKILFFLKENIFNIKLEGDVGIPSPPVLDFIINYTNKQHFQLKGKKDPYSSIFVNGKRIVRRTPDSNWKGYVSLRRGLNTLIVRAKNIWNAESKPQAVHITYFPYKTGEMKFFFSPKGIRVKREAGRSLISWEILQDKNVLGYNVYSGEESGGPYRKLNDSLVNGKSYGDMGINLQDYFYAVSAVRSDFESGFSEEVSGSMNSLGGTDLPNEINNDRVLSLRDSPYLISSKTIVKKGEALNIEPGVEIRFKKGRSSLSGKIIGKGNEGNPIKFTSDQKNPQKGDWEGLALDNGSVLIRTEVRFAGVGDRDAISTKGSVILSNNTITDSASNGVGVYAGKTRTKVLISGSDISRNGRDGINILNAGLDSNGISISSVVIRDNNIKGNAGGGVIEINEKNKGKKGAVHCYVDIANNSVGDNGSFAIVTNANASLTDNEISNNGYSDTVKIEGHDITRNVTWGKGIYQVPSLEIDDMAQIFIEPGVIIKAESNAAIKGKVLAEGTDKDKIIFTSVNDEYYTGPPDGINALAEGFDAAAKEGWEGLILEKGSSLENCIIKYASIGSSGIKADDGVNLVKIESYFISSEDGLFELNKLIDSLARVENNLKKKGKRGLIRIEILLISSVVIPLVVTIFLIAVFGGRNKRLK